MSARAIRVALGMAALAFASHVNAADLTLPKDGWTSCKFDKRKRAVFWLAQSETEGAQKYLEKVLVGNTQR